jgi:ABC-2 type transport system ATP-binding protein
VQIIGDVNTELPTDPVAQVDVVELVGLRKSFGAVPAVRGVDLTIRRDETVALLGPNGAGKSTTLDMLLGLARPDAGHVRIFGRSPADAIAAGLVGAMLQTGGLVRDLTVRELLAMVASLYPHPLAVDEVLARTGTERIADRRTQKLSGGESQRVRFAMALVAQPRLLVLDEPTGATEIKARVSQRTIRATLPDVARSELLALPGVTAAERHGQAVVLTCDDADTALRTLLTRWPSASDLEVRGAGLDEAFLALTSSEEEPAWS